MMRAAWGESLGLVNPGIRPAGSDVQDQKRVQTPAEAIRSGGNYLVIGRPILQAADPVAVVNQLVEELAGADCLSA
jgi:orotidine-5'-phosphate decarboxylase